MLHLYVIGIGAGDPAHMTVQAIEALNHLDVLLVVEKGPAADDLARLRQQIIDRFVAPGRRLRIVPIEDPPRDRTADQYTDAVAAWRDERTARYEAALAGLHPTDTAGFLVWGDPSLYDGTMLILDELRRRGRVQFDWTVIPGIASTSALAAAHRRPLNEAGESIAITTGRRVAAALPAAENIVVMLDGGEAWRTLPDDLDIWWGAYLATDDEVLVAGQLGDCRDEIDRVRTRMRAEKGWMFDTYLLRRR